MYSNFTFAAGYTKKCRTLWQSFRFVCCVSKGSHCQEVPFWPDAYFPFFLISKNMFNVLVNNRMAFSSAIQAMKHAYYQMLWVWRYSHVHQSMHTHPLNTNDDGLLTESWLSIAVSSDSMRLRLTPNMCMLLKKVPSLACVYKTRVQGLVSHPSQWHADKWQSLNLHVSHVNW